MTDGNTTARWVSSSFCDGPDCAGDLIREIRRAKRVALQIKLAAAAAEAEKRKL
jgi:hypothetical protein